MGEFFRGWKRKIGVITLVMACVIAIAWIRSFYFVDFIQWQSLSFCSAMGHLYGFVPESLVTNWGWPEWVATDLADDDLDSLSEGVAWKWRFIGFGHGEIVFFGLKFWVSIDPYWSIVIPLTLLSAYLLLSKPHKSNPKKITEPIASERA